MVEAIVLERTRVNIAPGVVQIIVAYQIKDGEWTSPVAHLFYDAAAYKEEDEKRDLQRVIDAYKRMKGYIK